jgi:outer membrane protein TolC
MQLKFYILIILLFVTQLLNAQSKANTNLMFVLDEKTDLQSQILPLDSIIEIAIKNSPIVRFQSDLIDAAKYQVDFSKRVWTNNIVGFVGYTAGNQNLISAGNQNVGTLDATNITNGYRMGIQLNLPLYEFVGRKSRVNLYKSQLNSTISKKEEAIQELKKEVIQTYYSMLYYNNLVNIRSDSKQTTINQYLIAQKQFKDGLIDVTELSRLKTIEVNSKADFEEAKRQFSTLYFLLENLVGVPMQQLILKK